MINTRVPAGPNNATPRYILKRNEDLSLHLSLLRNIHNGISTTATEKQPIYPTDGWTDKCWHTYTIDIHLAIKKGMIHAIKHAEP